MDVCLWLKADSTDSTDCVLDQYIICILLLHCWTAGFLELDIKNLFKDYA